MLTLATGIYTATQSYAATTSLSSLDCQLLGRPYSSSTCQDGCVSGAGSYITSAPVYNYCSGAVSHSVLGTDCTDRGRILTAGGNGCARRWQQTNLTGAIQCSDSSATYTVTSTVDYCASPQPTTIPPTTLPAGAPQPTPLSPQSPGVGQGANAIVTAVPDSVWNSMNGVAWNPYVGKTSSTPCPVGRSQLSYMTINYWGFDGNEYRGEMVFNSSKQSAFVSAFTALYYNHIPLHGMYLSSAFGYSSTTGGADDYASMQHDNTSAFNCRWVDGSSPTVSPHAYGTAVDINPFENPYNSAQGWTPNSWWAANNYPPYTARTTSDLLVRLMQSNGFQWTYGVDDSQHFDAK